MTAEARIGESVEDYPDVSGVPSKQLQALYEEYLDCDPTSFAARVGIEYNYLVRLVIKPTVSVVRLKYADRILHGLGLNLGILERDGLITVVPLTPSRTAAKNLVDEEIATAQWLGFGPPTEDEIQARIDEVQGLHKEHCQPTAYQLEKRRADAERIAARRAKEKGGS